ncbi:hypothetical protein CHS0354_021783 [Potamilus streckersoni]|uniref:B box-type domain-containing protein n=1 Tax=Potamilus streckersoni TaxID=2493646 RepID=A0AAE0VP83_9BIVA|nr:hypothetical protein CHS0354_021783 [Potamilus streckersoni]
MEQIKKPDCKHHPYNELSIHCPTHNYMVCSICTREGHKICFENETLRRSQNRNSTVQNILTKAKDLLEHKIDSLLTLEEWKITTKQEIECLRKSINAHLDQIQSRTEETMENVYKQEKQMNRKSLRDIEEIKTRGSLLEAKTSDLNEDDECLDEMKECLDRLGLEGYKQRPTVSKDMKAILQFVENMSSGTINLNLDMIIGSLTKSEDLVEENEHRHSIDFGCDFAEN